MIKLYHAPRTRSFRIVWLLEELGLRYEVETMTFVPPQTAFTQASPFGKFPAIEDGELTMFESGAILEYVIERYGNGRLAPAPGSALRGPYLQWLHFAEATAFPPIGEMVRHTIFKPESERIPAVVADARGRAQVTLGVPEKALGDKDYMIGDFSGADIMMGFTLVAAKLLGVLDDRFPNLQAYLARLEARPAFQKAAAT